LASRTEFWYTVAEVFKLYKTRTVPENIHVWNPHARSFNCMASNGRMVGEFGRDVEGSDRDFFF
jgi:hypothetical protein